MKVVILAGGLGTRISEETTTKPKPMVEIGSKPILWHIMKIYSSWGYREFVVCLGYKGYLIKEYFNNYLLHNNDVTVDLNDSKKKYHNLKSENWKIHLVDTGEETNTGGRIKKKFTNAPKTEVERTSANLSKLNNLIVLKNKTSIKSGINNFVSWYIKFNQNI